MNALTAKRVLDLEGWRELVCRAMHEHVRLAPAAASLGVHPATLKRWLTEDEVLRGVERPGRGRPTGSLGKRKRRATKKPRKAVKQAP